MSVNFYTYILFYFFIVCSTLGYGMAICSISEKYKISNNIGYTGLIGVFFIFLRVYVIFHYAFIYLNMCSLIHLLIYGFIRSRFIESSIRIFIRMRSLVPVVVKFLQRLSTHVIRRFIYLCIPWLS